MYNFRDVTTSNFLEETLYVCNFSPSLKYTVPMYMGPIRIYVCIRLGYNVILSETLNIVYDK